MFLIGLGKVKTKEVKCGEEEQTWRFLQSKRENVEDNNNQEMKNNTEVGGVRKGG